MCIIHPLDVNSPVIFECAQAGCAQCQEALLGQHKGLVHAVLRQQWRGDVSYVDLLQEGRIALWRAIMGYEPYRGTAFSGYAWRAIERRMWQVVAKRQRVVLKVRLECANVETYELISQVEDALWWEQVKDALAKMLGHLPGCFREVVVAAYGLDGRPARSLAAIGRVYGVTRENVRVWRNNALAQMRMPVYSSRLRALCDQNDREAYIRAEAMNRAWLGRYRKGGK